MFSNPYLIYAISVVIAMPPIAFLWKRFDIEPDPEGGIATEAITVFAIACAWPYVVVIGVPTLFGIGVVKLVQRLMPSSLGSQA